MPVGAILMPLIGTNNENEKFSDILESWEIADDLRSVTFTLRPNIEWSDGTPLTSSDVVMSLTIALDSRISERAGVLGGVAGMSAFADGKSDSISGLTAPDDLTVVVALEKPDAAWLSNLGATVWVTVLPAHILGDVPHDKLEDHEYFKTFPVTNGPYKFVDWVPEQFVELERNGNWSLGKAGFERVFFKNIPDLDARTAQLETGEIQFMWQVDPADADRIGSLDGIEIQTATGVAPFTLGLMQLGPLLDRRVRQAMAFAIDREGIGKDALQGYCTVPITNIRQIAPDWAIPTTDVTEYRFDPDHARKLLDEAGWDPNTKLTFLSFMDPGSPEARAVSIAEGNMADVGINWTHENIDVGALLERAENAPDSFNGWAVSGADFTTDPSNMEPYASCSTHYPNGPNLIRYCNKELDKLWAAGRLESDQDRRASIYQNAFRILNEEVPEIYLFVADHIVAYDAHLKGVKAHGNAPFAYWNIGTWHWGD